MITDTGDRPMILIAPSILSADFSDLKSEVRRIEEAGADMVHIDVMDGHFVPPITIGQGVVASLRPHTKLPFDVHLMVTYPERFIHDFRNAGADSITVHAEATEKLPEVLTEIRRTGARAGVSIKPDTSEEAIVGLLDKVDMVLIMTVNPGYGGQSFMPSTLDKIRRLREIITQRGLRVDIEVDGGINLETIQYVTEAGANVIVTGSASLRLLIKGCMFLSSKAQRHNIKKVLGAS
jgi:ribulose-phosphate 3-epimerase